MLYERYNEAGYYFPSKKALAHAVSILEDLLIEVTDVSSFKFAGGMFKLRKNKARVYSLQTTDLDTLVPEHNKSVYSRYAGDVPIIKGKINDDGTFTPAEEIEEYEENGKKRYRVLSWGEPMVVEGLTSDELKENTNDEEDEDVVENNEVEEEFEDDDEEFFDEDEEEEDFEEDEEDFDFEDEE